MKKIIKIENIILLLTILAVGLVLYLEFSYKKDDYLKEKIYDLELQYNEKVISNKRVVETLFREVLEKTQKQFRDEWGLMYVNKHQRKYQILQMIF